MKYYRVEHKNQGSEKKDTEEGKMVVEAKSKGYYVHASPLHRGDAEMILKTSQNSVSSYQN